MDTLKEVCKEVGKKLGKGFTENIYQEAICVYLRRMNIQYAKEVVLQVEIDQIPVGNVRADIVLPTENIVIECKAVESDLRDAHLPQIITYMNILNYNYGVYVNYMQNPSKQAVQIYYVQRDNNRFTFYDTDSQHTVVLDAHGNAVDRNIAEWVLNNICRDETATLVKSECKNLMPCKNQSEVRKMIACIEDMCGEKFKDKQVAGVKHVGVIPGWRLKQ